MVPKAPHIGVRSIPYRPKQHFNKFKIKSNTGFNITFDCPWSSSKLLWNFPPITAKCTSPPPSLPLHHSWMYDSPSFCHVPFCCLGHFPMFSSKSCLGAHALGNLVFKHVNYVVLTPCRGLVLTISSPIYIYSLIAFIYIVDVYGRHYVWPLYICTLYCGMNAAFGYVKVQFHPANM